MPDSQAKNIRNLPILMPVRGWPCSERLTSTATIIILALDHNQDTGRQSGQYYSTVS